MNIFHKVAFQGLCKSRSRTLVTIIGVMLSAAMITAVCSFGVSLLQYMVDGAALQYGGWHVGFVDVPAEFAQTRSRDQDVEQSAVLENLGIAQLEGSTNPDKPYLMLTGYSQAALRTMPLNLLSGRLPEHSGEVLVSGSISADGGMSLAVGDELTLTLGSRALGSEALGFRDPYQEGEVFIPEETHSYTVVGICQTPSYLRNSLPGYPLITTADHVSDSDLCSVFLTLEHPFGLRSYIQQAAQGQHVIQNDEVLRFMGLSNDKLFTTLILVTGGVVLGIIMIGSVFLIHNAFSISLNERTHQMGILMSVGATARQLRSSVLFEGLCIGVVGIPLGILLGLLAMTGVLAVVEKSFQNIMYDGVELSLVLSPPILALAALVSLFTILISAYIPARKAAATPVMDCIRQTGDLKVEARKVRTSSLTQHLFGLEGSLALKNFKRNKKRYRSIILSLVLSVVLFICTSSFAANLKQASEMANVATTFDLCLTVPDSVEDGELLSLLDVLKSANGVTSASYEEAISCHCTVDPQAISPSYWTSQGTTAPSTPVEMTLSLVFLDDRSFQQLLQENGIPSAGYIEGTKLLTIAKIDAQVNRVLEPDEFEELFSVPSLELPLEVKTADAPEGVPGPTVTLDIRSFLSPDIPINSNAEPIVQDGYIWSVFVPYSQKAQLVPPGALVSGRGLTFCSDSPSQTAAAMEELLAGADLRTGYTLLNLSKMVEQNNNMMFVANVFSYVFIVMISLIAVANVFNTISTNIKLRRRELAMLRSVGMAEQDFQKMMNFECFFYGLRALLFGLPISLLLSWLIYYWFSAGGADGLTFQPPWVSMGISVLSVFLVVFITMLYAVSQVKKENIIDAMRDDMT